jgi:hypothetical protein
VAGYDVLWQSLESDDSWVVHSSTCLGWAAGQAKNDLDRYDITILLFRIDQSPKEGSDRVLHPEAI